MSFAVHADSWLAEVMNRPVFRVDGSGATSEVASHIATRPRAFYFAKVPTDQVDDAHALTRLGFGVVDTNVTFELAGEPQAGPPTGVDVGEIASGDADAVLAIAGSAFRYSRFHLDPQIDSELANHIKRAWIRNYIDRKRGDALLVARQGGRVCGFLAALDAHEASIIDLIAVANDGHGQGIGSALTLAFAARYRGRQRLVGTQIANVPSIRLYNKLGFQLAKSQYVLHLHT